MVLQMYSPKRSSSSSNLPPKSSLSRSTSNGVQVGSSSLIQVKDSGSFRHSIGSNSTSSDMNIDSLTQVFNGLVIYRSTPSSFLASLVEEVDDYFPRVTGSDEPDHTYIARYFSADSKPSSGVIQSNGPERSSVEEKEGGPGNQFGGIMGLVVLLGLRAGTRMWLSIILLQYLRMDPRRLPPIDSAMFTRDRILDLVWSTSSTTTSFYNLP